MSLLDGNITYDPTKEYFFIDYHDIEECRWIRSPYNTIEEVHEKITNLPYVYDREKKENLPMFRRLRVTPHTHLDELYRVWNEEEEKWDNDDITKGYKEFGSKYDHPEFYGMPPSMTKRDHETREEWEARVAVRQEEIEKGWKEDFAEDRRRKEIWDSYESPQVAYLYGLMKRKDIAELLRDTGHDIEESDED